MEQQEVGLDKRFDNTNPKKKVLKDIQIKDGAHLNNKMAHVDIINNNLVLTIDFESNNRFAIVEYLQLAGISIEDIVKHELVDPIDEK